jgi:hypothetical protein
MSDHWMHWMDALRYGATVGDGAELTLTAIANTSIYDPYMDPLIKRDIMLDAAWSLAKRNSFESTPAIPRQNEIDVYMKDKLVGSLSTSNIELSGRSEIVLTYIEDSAQIIARNIMSREMPTKPKHIILTIAERSFDIDRIKFERMKTHAAPWPSEVPRYAEYIEMPNTMSLRFRWKALLVTEEAYEELFDFDEFEPA